MSSSTNTLGKYQIIREIGRSNDIVYEALDPSINRRVALKELWIAPNLQGAQKRERIERFRREGKAAGRLSHPNIVTIYEVGQEGDRFYIAMEYLEGQTLRDFLMNGGPLPIKTATDYMLQLCAALSYAHVNGVIHRDIKPDNVQILPGGQVKLTDFGIARLTDEPSITQDGQVFGTPSYMSPEQVAGKNLDARSDIFSMGVLFYEMVAGQKPFSGDSVVTITYNIMHMEAPPPPGAPQWVAGIIRKAMAKDADMRYSSVEELAEDLREQKSSDQFVAGPMSTGAWPSPFGGASQPPPQPPQGPLTPYGTPMPSQQAGSAPDPFAQHAPGRILQPMPPPAPAKPVMSAETRNFVGIFLLVIGLCGMLVFAVWAVNLAYSSYVTQQTTEAARRYYEQGVHLSSEGKVDAAIYEWRLAVERAPQSKVAGMARDEIYKAGFTLFQQGKVADAIDLYRFVIHNAPESLTKRNATLSLYDALFALAYRQYAAGDIASLSKTAREMTEVRADAPEGHFYLGHAYQMRGESQAAIDQYKTAVEQDKTGPYGPAAQQRIDALTAASGGNQPDSNGRGNAPSAPKSDIPYIAPEPGT